MLSTNHSTVEMESMTSCCPPSYFRIVKGLKSEIGFGSAGKNVSFIESVESSLLCFLKDKSGKCCDGFGSCQVSIDLSNA